jgi:hypothetical protein
MRFSSSKRPTVLLSVNVTVDKDAGETSKKYTETDAEKCETALRGRERVWWGRKDGWEGGKKEKEGSEGERRVDGERQDDRLPSVIST